MTVETVMVGGRRIFVVGPPNGSASAPLPAEGNGLAASVRALLGGVPIPREDARAVALALDEIETQVRSLLADCVLLVTGLEVIAAEARDARKRLGR